MQKNILRPHALRVPRLAGSRPHPTPTAHSRAASTTLLTPPSIHRHTGYISPRRRSPTRVPSPLRTPTDINYRIVLEYVARPIASLSRLVGRLHLPRVANPPPPRPHLRRRHRPLERREALRANLTRVRASRRDDVCGPPAGLKPDLNHIAALERAVEHSWDCFEALGCLLAALLTLVRPLGGKLDSRTLLFCRPSSHQQPRRW